MRERSVGVDLLKVIAIGLVICAHFVQVVHVPGCELLFAILVNIGVGSFVFASGYLLFMHHPNIEGWSGAKSFYKDRLLRLMPLYWAGLLLAFLLTPQEFYSPQMYPVFLAGLQIVPNWKYDMSVFWFVGMILALYLFYPVLSRYASDRVRLLAVSAALIVPLMAISHFTGLIDFRLFLYYPVFIAGIIVSRVRDSPMLRGRNMLVPSSAGFVLSLLVMPYFNYGRWVGLGSPIMMAGNFLVVASTVVSASLLIIGIGSFVASGQAVKRLRSMSSATYSIYLLHMTILLVSFHALVALGVDGPLLMLLMIVPTVASVAIGMAVDDGVKQLSRTWRERTKGFPVALQWSFVFVRRK